MDLRILAFPVVWVLLAVAEYTAIVWSQRSTRQSTSSGYVTRVVSSLVLALLGYTAGLHHLVMLGAIYCGDYRALGPSLGWIVWAGAAVAALVPWTAWACRRTLP